MAVESRRFRGAALAGLITLTVSLGVAAKISKTNPDPGVTPGPAVQTTHGPLAMSAHVDRTSVLMGGDGLVRIELAIRAEDSGRDTASVAIPTDLVVVLDRSGSMQGQALNFAKAAIHELVGQLGPNDRFGLVTYASNGGLAIPLEGITPTARVRWRQSIDRIHAGGGTHMAVGLDLAHGLLDRGAVGRAQRVVLLSDGHANEGDHSLAGLRSRAARAVAAEYVVSAVGVGDDFDETVMSAIADAGTGNFYYLPHLERLTGVFGDEFASARETMASSLSVSLRQESGMQLQSASGYPIETQGRKAVFRPGSLFAGQERRIWLTLQLPTDEAGRVSLPPIELGYSDASGERHMLALDGLPQIACVVAEKDFYASFDADVYRRAALEEGLGALKERVAAKMKRGDQAQAVAEVESYEAEMRHEQLKAFGHTIDGSFASSAALKDEVSAPAAASPAEQKKLGKSLLQSGRDQRRSGSKR